MRHTAAAFVAAVLLTANLGWSASKQAERLGESAQVFQEIMDTPDQGIPADLLARSACIGIFPSVKKLAFVVGGSHGAGYILCRKNEGRGPWGPPAGFSVSGGSFGPQIGGSATDLVLLFMNQEGVKKLLEDKFTLGADASVAAGPVGRSAAASTDAQMTAKVLSYSRSKGLFAGLALNGAVLKASGEDNRVLYGEKATARDLLLVGSPAAPASAARLMGVLSKHSAKQTEKPL